MKNKKIDIKIKPLSVNICWQGRRFKTKKYKDYEQEFSLLAGRGKQIKGEVIIFAIFYIKNYKTSDCGNFEKPLMDIVTKLDYIEDDRFIKMSMLLKQPVKDKKDQAIKVFIEKCNLAGFKRLNKIIKNELFD